MIISGFVLTRRLNSGNIVENLNNKYIKNSSYSMRIGKFFVPKGNGEWPSKIYKLLPGNVIIVETLEKVNLPKDLCAMYSMKQTKASEGLLLVNASMVEPGYSGKLSCFIINVSSQSVILEKEEPISKLTFFKVSGISDALSEENRDDKSYSLNLAKTAQRFDEKFLSINQQITDVIKGEVDKSRRAQFFFVFLLITIATVAPYFSNYLLSYKIPQSSYDFKRLEEMYKTQEQKLEESALKINELKEVLRDMEVGVAGESDEDQ